MDDLEIIKRPVEKEIKNFEKHFRANVNSDVPLLDIINNYIINNYIYN